MHSHFQGAKSCRYYMVSYIHSLSHKKFAVLPPIPGLIKGTITMLFLQVGWMSIKLHELPWTLLVAYGNVLLMTKFNIWCSFIYSLDNCNELWNNVQNRFLLKELSHLDFLHLLQNIRDSPPTWKDTMLKKFTFIIYLFFSWDVTKK
jgi:hypothetical protein